MFRYESGHVELMEGAEGVLGLRSPVPQMDADLFLDVAWRRMKLLPAIIDDLRQAEITFRQESKYGELGAVRQQIKIYDEQLRTLGEYYISVEMMLLNDILPTILSSHPENPGL